MFSKLNCSRSLAVPATTSLLADTSRWSASARRVGAIAIAGVLTAATFSTFVREAAAAPAEAGVWINESGQGAVEIKPCGAQKLCGHIVWLQDPLRADGTPKRDIYNPDGRRRNTPICGLQVLGNLAPMGNGSWDNGWVYDPKKGKAYNVTIRLLSKRKLEVHGYQGMKLLGKTMTWTRARQPLPACTPEPDQAAVN